MRRYIAFLDILGFKKFITTTPLNQAVKRMSYIFSFAAQNCKIATVWGSALRFGNLFHPSR